MLLWKTTQIRQDEPFQPRFFLVFLGLQPLIATFSRFHCFIYRYWLYFHLLKGLVLLTYRGEFEAIALRCSVQNLVFLRPFLVWMFFVFSYGGWLCRNESFLCKELFVWISEYFIVLAFFLSVRLRRTRLLFYYETSYCLILIKWIVACLLFDSCLFLTAHVCSLFGYVF